MAFLAPLGAFFANAAAGIAGAAGAAGAGVIAGATAAGGALVTLEASALGTVIIAATGVSAAITAGVAMKGNNSVNSGWDSYHRAVRIIIQNNFNTDDRAMAYALSSIGYSDYAGESEALTPFPPVTKAGEISGAAFHNSGGRATGCGGIHRFLFNDTFSGKAVYIDLWTYVKQSGTNNFGVLISRVATASSQSDVMNWFASECPTDSLPNGPGAFDFHYYSSKTHIINAEFDGVRLTFATGNAECQDLAVQLFPGEAVVTPEYYLHGSNLAKAPLWDDSKAIVLREFDALELLEAWDKKCRDEDKDLPADGAALTTIAKEIGQLTASNFATKAATAMLSHFFPLVAAAAANPDKISEMKDPTGGDGEKAVLIAHQIRRVRELTFDALAPVMPPFILKKGSIPEWAFSVRRGRYNVVIYGEGGPIQLSTEHTDSSAFPEQRFGEDGQISGSFDAARNERVLTLLETFVVEKTKIRAVAIKRGAQDPKSKDK